MTNPPRIIRALLALLLFATPVLADGGYEGQDMGWGAIIIFILLAGFCILVLASVGKKSD